MEKKFAGVISAAVLVEGIITYVNTFFVQGVVYWQMILSLAIGVIVAVVYRFDIPLLFDMKSKVPYVGEVLSGILISRGSNYLFDLVKKLSGY